MNLDAKVENTHTLNRHIHELDSGESNAQCEHMNLFIIPALASFCHFIFPLLFDSIPRYVFILSPAGNQANRFFFLTHPPFEVYYALDSLSFVCCCGCTKPTRHTWIYVLVLNHVYGKNVPTTFSTILTSAETKQNLYVRIFRARIQKQLEWSQEKLIYALAENGREIVWNKGKRRVWEDVQEFTMPKAIGNTSAVFFSKMYISFHHWW